MKRFGAWRSARGAFLLIALCGPYYALPANAQEGARRATPPPGKALVFVFRADRQSIAAPVPVVVNTTLVGELANGTFTTATVNPGRTYLRIGDRVVSTLSFLAEANQSYFVWVEAVYGQTLVRTEVYLVGETEGRRSLAESRFVGIAPAVAAAVPPTEQLRAAADPPTEQPRAAAEPAASEPEAVPQLYSPIEQAGVEGQVALIVNTGRFKLAKGSQEVAGLPSTYDTTSKSAFGAELEWRSKAGFAVSGEAFRYENELALNAPTTNARQEVFALMVNGKYYFRAASWFYPFVGAGVGGTSVTYSGALKGTATGPAYQGLAGMELRFKPVGLHLQYKYLSSTTGDSGRKVNVGGSGILVGVSISF